MNPPPYLQDILRLSVDDRIRLATLIWDSVAAEDSPPDLTEAQWAEVDRRVEEYRRDPSRGIPAEEEVFRELREKYDE